MYIKPLMPAGLAANVNIMPQYFQQAGYTTHAIGKWHLGFCHQNYTPTYRGFDTFYGFYLGSQVRKESLICWAIYVKGVVDVVRGQAL